MRTFNLDGDILFIQIDNSLIENGVSPKYMMCHTTKGLMPSVILTEKEVRKLAPQAIGKSKLNIDSNIKEDDIRVKILLQCRTASGNSVGSLFKIEDILIYETVIILRDQDRIIITCKENDKWYSLNKNSILHDLDTAIRLKQFKSIS